MTDKVIEQTDVFAILSKLNFLDFPFVTHQGGPQPFRPSQGLRPGLSSSVWRAGQRLCWGSGSELKE